MRLGSALRCRRPLPNRRCGWGRANAASLARAAHSKRRRARDGRAGAAAGSLGCAALCWHGGEGERVPLPVCQVPSSFVACQACTSQFNAMWQSLRDYRQFGDVMLQGSHLVRPPLGCCAMCTVPE